MKPMPAVSSRIRVVPAATLLPLPDAAGPWQSGRPGDDAEIARNARAALSEQLMDIASGLRVVVCDGVVDVAGDLESGDQKSIVEETIGRLAGVKAVNNRIRVMPPSKLAMRTLYR